MLKYDFLKIFLLLAIASAQCGVIIIVDDNNINTQNFRNPQNFDTNEIPHNDGIFSFSDFLDFDDTPDLPDPKNVALMSRFIVHKANWTSVAYTSHSGRTNGQSLAAMFSVSDGPVDSGSGIPYFYVSRLQSAVNDLLDVDNRCSLMMSLAETDICQKKGWDPEDPRCGHVVLTGTFHKLVNKSREYIVAAKAVFSRHPSFIHLPESHHFFLAKFNIETITIQDAFGGPSQVSLSDYFNANNPRFQLTPNQFYSYENNFMGDNDSFDFYSVFNV